MTESTRGFLFSPCPQLITLQQCLRKYPLCILELAPHRQSKCLCLAICCIVEVHCRCYHNNIVAAVIGNPVLPPADALGNFPTASSSGSLLNALEVEKQCSSSSALLSLTSSAVDPNVKVKYKCSSSFTSFTSFHCPVQRFLLAARSVKSLEPALFCVLEVRPFNVRAVFTLTCDLSSSSRACVTLVWSGRFRWQHNFLQI